MSQDTFPFDAGDDQVPHAEEGQHNRKAILVAGGVAAALVVAAAGYFLLSGGSDDGVSLAAVPHVAVHHAAAPPPAVAKPVKKLPTAYTANLGRDPFKALYVVPAAAPVGPAPAAQPAAPAPATGPGSSTNVGSTGTKPYALKLVAISKPSPESRFFSWTVDGTKATVLPAQRFGKYGEIVVLAYERSSTGAATGAIIQVGDDSPVDVAIGDVINVL
jgi:hypothetical protein